MSDLMGSLGKATAVSYPTATAVSYSYKMPTARCCVSLEQAMQETSLEEYETQQNERLEKEEREEMQKAIQKAYQEGFNAGFQSGFSQGKVQAQQLPVVIPATRTTIGFPPNTPPSTPYTDRIVVGDPPPGMQPSVWCHTNQNSPVIGWGGGAATQGYLAPATGTTTGETV